MSKKRIQFHISSDDYFGTLATTLDLLLQTIEKRGYRRRDGKLLVRLRNELLYLQAHYIIRP